MSLRTRWTACIAGVLISTMTLSNSSLADSGKCSKCTSWDCQEPEMIEQVQEALQRAGATITPSGEFNNSTKMALKDFANKHKLPNIGPHNMAFLNALFPDPKYENVRKQIWAAWVC